MKKINQEKGNFENIGRAYYIVRTQAGFKKAIKHWCIDSGVGNDEQTWREIRKKFGQVMTFPSSYPSVVCFYELYNTGPLCCEVVSLSFLAGMVEAYQEIK